VRTGKKTSLVIAAKFSRTFFVSSMKETLPWTSSSCKISPELSVLKQSAHFAFIDETEGRPY